MESNTKTPRLSGGIFFNLLVETHCDSLALAKTTSGIEESSFVSGMMQDLVRLVDPQWAFRQEENSLRIVNEYRGCETSAEELLPFSHPTFASMMRDEMEHAYDLIHCRMNGFIRRYFREVYHDDPVRKLVERLGLLICNDSSIPENEAFHVRPGNYVLTKQEIKSVCRLMPTSFLLGVYYYIVQCRPNNTVGRETAKCMQGLPGFWKSDMLPIRCVGKYLYLFDRSPSNQTLLSRDIRKDVSLKGLSEYDYANYLQNACRAHQYIHTLLYRDQPQLLRDFYVCNDVTGCSGNDVTVMNLIGSGSYRPLVTLSGNAGIGKSMMMHHLMLDSIARYNTTRLVPVLVKLKDYEPAISSRIFDFLYENVSALCDISDKEFHDSLVMGDIVVLMDGLDEIPPEYYVSFRNELNYFLDRFPRDIVILSTRPGILPHSDAYGLETVSFEGKDFLVKRIKPFSKQQALRMIDGVIFRPDRPEIKAAFRNLLDDHLFEDNRIFSENPLLLTVMLMTFERYGNIPSRIHVFYEEAYSVLAQRHDAGKGAYLRTLRTRLDADCFADYLSEFCMRTYIDRNFSFTREEFDRYFDDLQESSRHPGGYVRAQDFLYDLEHNICLLYGEGNQFYFIHRSFQEYFCARFFSRQPDRTLRRVGDFLDSGKQDTDNVFAMLYDMIPKKVEDYIFLPLLRDIFDFCRQEYGYWSYLMTVHPAFSFTADAKTAPIPHDPTSYLLRFLMSEICRLTEAPIPSLPLHEEYAKLPYLVPDNPKEGGIIFLNAADLDKVNLKDYPEGEFGVCYTVYLQDLWNDDVSRNDIPIKEDFRDIIPVLDSPECTLKQEYIALSEYYDYLCRRQNREFSGDLYDMF